MYAPVLKALSDALDRHIKKENPVVLDAGCGEGYYIKDVCPGRAMTRIGFDLSKEAIRLAAKGEKRAAFLVADLKRIPLGDHVCDAVLDIFTPADYAEFARVLRPGGLLFKLAPRSGYLAQLRELAGDQLRRQTYDGGDVARYAGERMDMLEQIDVTYTLPVTQELAFHLARMTPMLAGVDIDRLDLSAIHDITIDETMYIGTIKK